MTTNTITGIVSISSGTQASWIAGTKIIPQGIVCYETDTGQAKVANGTNLYSALSYFIGPLGALNIGNGLQNSSGALAVQASDTTITVGSGGIKVAPTALAYPESDHGSVSSGTVTLDRSVAAEHHLQVSGALSVAFSNWPASGNFSSMVLKLDNGGSATITWPTVQWIKSDGTGNTTTSFASSGYTLQTSGTDWISFWTRDGGSNIYAKVVR